MKDELQTLKDNIAYSAIFFVYALDKGRPDTKDVMEILFNNVDAIRRYHIENGGSKEFADVLGDYMVSQGIQT